MEKNKKSFIGHILNGRDSEVISDFQLEMRGEGDLSVSGCCGFFEYSPSAIGLVLRKGRLKIYGEGLLSHSYTNGAVLIKGKIRAIELLSEGCDETVL